MLSALLVTEAGGSKTESRDVYLNNHFYDELKSDINGFIYWMPLQSQVPLVSTVRF